MVVNKSSSHTEFFVESQGCGGGNTTTPAPAMLTVQALWFSVSGDSCLDMLADN